jgi:hypothetical protein
MGARLDEVVGSRPRTRRVPVVDGDIEATYQGLLRVMPGG